jgi:hypothetical protein
MLTRVCLILTLLTAAPIWAQLESTPFEIPINPTDEAQMLTPPPVSTESYPTTVGSQMRSNYLDAGLIFNTAYNDNVLIGGSTTSIGDITYTISPTIMLDHTASRQHLALKYSPGFTFYQHNSSLNASDQNANINFQYRLNQHTTLTLSDSFQKSSNVFNQLYPLFGGGISGSSQSPPPQVVAPYANQINNTANIGLNYQFSRNDMIGASGIATEVYYSNPAEATGLYNSNSLGGTVFYNRRLSSTQYVGVTYQYLVAHNDPANPQGNPGNSHSEVRTNSILAFYTVYLNPTVSLSLSSGPQYFDVIQSSSPEFHAWTPSVVASIGWQRSNTNFVASYSRTVTGGTGLAGVSDLNSVSASARCQITRTWTVGLTANYFINKTAGPVSSSNLEGHTVSGTASVQHSISERLTAVLGYTRLNQTYSGIAVISSAPDSNREFISLSYQLTRPLGR